MANEDKALAALADPTRRIVFERLARGPQPVGELADGLPVSRPAVSPFFPSSDLGGGEDAFKAEAEREEEP
jgi:hypothetical protein